MRKRVARWVLLVVVPAGLVGCDLVAGQLLAEFELEVTAPDAVVDPGGTADVTVEIRPVLGVTFSQVTVTLEAVEPEAEGFDADPLVVFGAGEYPWQVRVAESVPAGTYELTAEAVSQGVNLLPVERRATFALEVGR